MQQIKARNSRDSGEYKIDQSCLFDGSTSYINRTPSVEGNRRTWTLSWWEKKATPDNGYVYSQGSSNTLWIGSSGLEDGELYIRSGDGTWGYRTDSQYNDPSAWYHFNIAVDTTQANDADRLKIYVNGIQQDTTAFDGVPGLNEETGVNDTTPIWIGKYSSSAGYKDGYLSDVNFIDGLALGPEYFAVENSKGHYNPVKYTGEYGTNGFHLEFTDNGGPSSGYYTDTFLSGTESWTAPEDVTSVEYLVVAGGGSGAGGRGGSPGNGGSGGGAGGLLTGTLAVTPGSSYDITVGEGGVGAGADQGTKGSDSVFASIISYGGGAGLVKGGTQGNEDGGSGGGPWATAVLHGTGVAGQGHDGADSASGNGAGGGGAGGPGINTPASSSSGPGGVGVDLSFTFGTSVGVSGWFAGGGGGSYNMYMGWGANPGAGGKGGGGRGGTPGVANGGAGTVNSGGGGGGGSSNLAGANSTGGRGGSGIVIVRYKSVDRGIGQDYSGNENDFQTTGLTPDSIVADSPTNNYATLNPLFPAATGTPVFANGNLEYTTYLTGGDNVQGIATQGFLSGKWYWEIEFLGFIGSGIARGGIGFGNPTGNSNWTVDCTSAGYLNIFDPIAGGSHAHGCTVTGIGDSWNAGVAGDIYCMALDADAGTFVITKNTPVTGNEVNGVWSGISSDSVQLRPITVESSTSVATNMEYNFGQRTFAYDPPAGYLPLCTDNLPAVTVKPKEHFNTVLYTGKESPNNVTGVGFSPGLFWNKSRTAPLQHMLYDTVRGATKYLVSNDVDPEATDVNSLTSFDSDGVTLGSSGSSNSIGTSFVGWSWKAGGSAVPNTDGSIPSQVSANKDMGFSIVKYQGNGINSSVGHGLGVAPSMVIIKSTALEDWVVYSNPVGGGGGLLLNISNSVDMDSRYFNNQDPDSLKLYLGTQNRTNYSGQGMIAYCFTNTDMLQVGSYTGNGLDDGPFVSLPFKPAFLLNKPIDASGGWLMQDNGRHPYNTMTNPLFAEDTGAEIDSPTYLFDFYSNGFKPRGVNNSTNNSSGKPYLYLAIAEETFKHARGR